jgi:proteic killer suppression protein
MGPARAQDSADIGTVEPRPRTGGDEHSGTTVPRPHGDRKGQYAVSVSGNWRIVFEYEGEDATNVDLVDYH